MPDLAKLGKGAGKFFRGKSKKALERDGLRILIFGTEADGSRVIYDCAVQLKTANKAN
jgi:hypothetical protein